VGVKINFIFLLKAIKENFPIDISYIEGDKTWEYTSRFLKLSSDGQSFIIDMPLMEDTYRPLKKGYSIYIFFVAAGLRFQFKTDVKEKIQYYLNEQGKIPALKVAWPVEILDGNRRSMYRAEVSLDESIHVNYTILNKGQKKKSVESDQVSKYNSVHALMIDISRGGLSLKIRDRQNISVNDKVKLEFLLKELDNEYIEIEGKVANIRKYGDSRFFICGIKFSPRDSKTNMQALQKISLYIMSRNKENISFFTVNSIVSKNSLVQKIVDGEVNRDMLNMLMNKEFLLSEVEYLESLAYVLKYKEFKKQAVSLLKKIPLDVKIKYSKRMDANHRVIHYILSEALTTRKLDIVATIAGNPHLPIEFCYQIAKEGTLNMLWTLMVNKNRLIAYPRVMELVKKNHDVSPSLKKKIEEIDKFYLQEETSVDIPQSDVVEDLQVALSHQKKEAGSETGSSPTKEALEEALVRHQRINRMTIRERIKLTFNGNLSERLILSKDTNKLVLMALVESPQVTEEEIIRILKNHKAPTEVVRKIYENPLWLGNYGILLYLLKSPKVPPKIIPDLIKKVQLKDLKEIIRMEGIRPRVRDLAVRYLEINR
jgi:c-di-GMP-binding flagellar brake protein YcgR